MKKFLITLLAVIMIAALSSCGSKKSESSTGSAGARQDMTAPAPASVPAENKAEAKPTADTKLKNTANEAAKAVEADRKIIYSASSVIDVKDLTGAYDSILAKTREFGGYVANSSIRDIQSQITVRVPASKLEDFLKYLDTLGGDVKETTISTNDITDQYTDAKSRTRNLKAQEEQLLGIMKKANTVEETLKIQSELFRVRGEIESLEGKINMWDKLVEYSTVTIRLNKVQEIGQKDVKISIISINEIIIGMSNGFKSTLNSVVRFIAGVFIVLISLLPIVPFIAIAVWIVLKFRKRHKKDITP